MTHPVIRLTLPTHQLSLLPPSGSFGVTKKAKAGRLGVSGPPLFCPFAIAREDNRAAGALAILHCFPPTGVAKSPFMQKTSDINVVETRVLPSPAALLAELPKSDAQAEFVSRSRQEIHRIIFGDDRRRLLIVGPCSIHDLAAGPRVCPAPGRPRPGGRGPDPDRDAGLFRKAAHHRRLEGAHHGPPSRRLARYRRRACAWPAPSCGTCSTSGCPRPPSCSTRSPRSTSPTWSAGRRSAPAPPSRRPTARWPRGCRCPSDSRTAPTARLRLRSTPSAPRPAADLPRASISTARPPRWSPRGNPNCHIVLRGGGGGPNYSPAQIAQTEQLVGQGRAASVDPRRLLPRQLGQAAGAPAGGPAGVLAQIAAGNVSILGAMIESNLQGGTSLSRSPRKAAARGLDHRRLHRLADHRGPGPRGLRRARGRG